MKHLSRDNIEVIANRVFKAYKALPDIKNSECYRIEPEKLILEVLGLNIFSIGNTPFIQPAVSSWFPFSALRFPAGS